MYFHYINCEWEASTWVFFSMPVIVKNLPDGDQKWLKCVVDDNWMYNVLKVHWQEIQTWSTNTTACWYQNLFYHLFLAASKYSLSFKFCHLNSVCIFLLSSMCYIPYPCHSLDLMSLIISGREYKSWYVTLDSGWLWPKAQRCPGFE
jgi:hypothetical protein